MTHRRATFLSVVASALLACAANASWLQTGQLAYFEGVPEFSDAVASCVTPAALQYFASGSSLSFAAVPPKGYALRGDAQWVVVDKNDPSVMYTPLSSLSANQVYATYTGYEIAVAWTAAFNAGNKGCR